jgi:hypothetical protein
MGFTKDDNGFTELKNYMESYLSKNEAEKTKFDQAIQHIDQSVVDAWTKCINRSGLSFWIETTKDPKTFIVAAHFLEKGDPKPKIKRFDFGDAKVTNNDGSFLLKNGKINKSTLIGGQILKQSFKRVGNGPVTIIISPTSGDAFLYSFAPIGKIPSRLHRYAMVWDGHGRTDPTEFENRYLGIHQNANPMSGFLKFQLTKSGLYILDGVGESIKKIKEQIQTWRTAYIKNNQTPNEYIIIDLECLKNGDAEFILNKSQYFQSGEDSQLPPQIDPSCIVFDTQTSN